MQKFIIKILIFFLIPGFLILSSYFFLDPFKVLKKYKDYSENMVVPLNRDFVSTEMYLQNREKYRYNSFIFGSSRTLAFKTQDWKPHLSKNSSPFVFDASGETLDAIHDKILFIDKLDDSLSNVLLVICSDWTFSNPAHLNGHIFIKHPMVSKKSWVSFHLCFLKAFFSKAFFFKYTYFHFFKEYQSFRAGIIEKRNIKFNKITNDLRLPDQEALIKNNSQKYYTDKKSHFYNRKQLNDTSYEKLIKREHIVLLKEIASIFKKHNTNYKIIISPLYNQIKFNSNDLSILENIFGENIFDYSGVNEITNNVQNYYEISHYRPLVENQILNQIYNHEKEINSPYNSSVAVDSGR